MSNIIYGMGLMGAEWHSMGAAYTDAASTAVVASFGVAVQRRGGCTLSIPTMHVHMCVCICVSIFISLSLSQHKCPRYCHALK